MPITPEMIDSIPMLSETNLPLPVYRKGKVRDNYEGPDGTLISVATDRVSAFDVVLPQAIPYKGHFLTATSVYTFENTRDVVENHFIESPHFNIVIARKLSVHPVEAVVRGYIAGSAWRAYSEGQRDFFGVKLPDGLRENQRLDSLLFTPTTKAEVGHDIPLETQEDYFALIGDERTARKIIEISLALYDRASQMAERNGYIFVDTKYEFGKPLVLVDEANTHDSSRMMERSLYERLFDSNAPSKEWDLAWMDKQYLRKWLVTVAGWEGEGEPPDIPNEVRAGVSNRVAGSYKAITGRDAVPPSEPTTNEAIAEALERAGYLKAA